MKYIFRYALLTHFTDKQDQITEEQLQEALRASKFALKGRNLSDLVDKSKNSIEDLARKGEKGEVQALIKESFGAQELTEKELADLANVWQLEKHLVFKKILASNTKSSDSYAGMSWAVRNSITSRSSQAGQGKTVTLSVRGHSQQTSLSLNKQGFQRMYKGIERAQEFLNGLLGEAE